MTHQRCIYCLNEIGDETPSLEHIIPSALGGRHPAVTRDCCHKCNNRLGETIDADFLEDPLIAFTRVTFGLKGQSGKEPTVKGNFQGIESGLNGRIVFAQYSVSMQARPKVETISSSDGRTEQVISGSRESVRPILEGKFAKARRLGQTIMDGKGRTYASVDELMAAVTGVDVDEVKTQLVTDRDHVARGLAKIAYGAAHLLLGGQWAFSPSAVALRKAFNEGSQYETDLQPVYRQADPRIREAVLGVEPATANDHLLAVLPGDGGNTVLVSLFGRMGPHAGFSIPHSTEDEHTALLRWTAITIDPVTGATREIPFHDLAIVPPGARTALAEALSTT